MKKYFYIILPSLKSSGPVKGAIALANGLQRLEEDVGIVILKKPKITKLIIESNIRIIDLSELNWLQKILKLKALISEQTGIKIYSISYALSADFFNLFFSRSVNIMVSVRGDLFQNYRYDYIANM